MSSIVEIETFCCAMPTQRGFAQFGIEKTLDQRVLLRLITNDGVEGWGEATALPQWGGMDSRYYGETVTTVIHSIHDLFSSAILNSDPRSPRLTIEKLNAILVGHPYAKATVEMALQDIRGKLCGEPLYRLLGGAWREGIRIGHMLGLMDIDDAIKEAARCIEFDGITAFQIKGGADPTRDEEIVEQLRKSLPEDIFLRLDANKGYGKIPKVAAAIVSKLEVAGVDAVEQPAGSLEALKACQASVSIPIIADEACWTPIDVLELWRANAADAVSVYVAKAGGMGPSSDVAKIAALVGYRCDINGSLETGIGNAASMHVALAAETLTLPSIIPIPSTKENPLTKEAGHYFDDDVVDTGFSYKAGFLYITNAPGLGINVNEKKVRKFTIGQSTISKI